MAPSMWQRTEALTKKSQKGSSLWLALPNDGDKVVVVFLGEPYPHEVCLVDGKYVEFNDQLKAEGHKSLLRVALNVVRLDTGEVRVFEVGVAFFKALLRFRDQLSLDKWAFVIQRHGAAKDPKTTYSISPDQQLTADQQSMLLVLAQHDLHKLYASESSGGKGRALDSYDQKTRALVEPGVALELTLQLKALPQAAIEQFLQKFGVQRTEDLPASEANNARVLMEQLRAEFANADHLGAEIDPFA